MEIKLNLASRPYLNRRGVRIWLILSSAFLVLFLVLNFLYGYQNYRQLGLLDIRFQELESQLSGMQGTPAGYSEQGYLQVKSEIALANGIISADQFHWTHLLSRFEELLPEDVSIRSIKPNFKDRSVQLAGVARDITSMTHFIDNLLASSDLKNAFLQRHSENEKGAPAQDLEQVDFTLVILEAF